MKSVLLISVVCLRCDYIYFHKYSAKPTRINQQSSAIVKSAHYIMTTSSLLGRVLMNEYNEHYRWWRLTFIVYMEMCKNPQLVVRIKQKKKKAHAFGAERHGLCRVVAV